MTETVARASSPRGELVLRRREDGHLELRANGVFVMDTLEHTSERGLAARALEIAHGPSLRVLVGGLGLGFTLGAVLADARVTRCTWSRSSRTWWTGCVTGPSPAGRRS